MIVLRNYSRKTRNLLAGFCALFAVLTSVGDPSRAIPPLLFMAAALAYRNELRLDLRRRRYVRLQGLLGLVRPRSGDFSELRGILLDRVPANAPSGGTTFSTTLAWHDGRQEPWVLDWGSDLATMASDARLAADRMEVPLLMGEGLRELRQALENLPSELSR
jgi:hypothetical protein